MDLDADQRAIRLAQEGDDAAFRTLVERHWPWAVHMARRHVPRAVDAEDVVQEAFFLAYRHLRRCRAETGFAPWFARIVINTARSFSRKAFHQDQLIAEPVALRGNSPPVDPLEVWDLVDRLPPRLATALFLRYQYDLTEEEVASVLGCPVGTVKSRLYEARRALGRAWNQASGGSERLQEKRVIVHVD